MRSIRSAIAPEIEAASPPDPAIMSCLDAKAQSRKELHIDFAPTAHDALSRRGILLCAFLCAFASLRQR
jgi:hypothetical protein